MEVDGGAYCAGDSDQMTGLVQDPATTPPSDELVSSSDAFLSFWTVPNSSSSCHAATDTMPDVEDHGVSARPPPAKTTAAPTAEGGELATEDDPERSYHQVQPEKKRRLSEEQVRRLEKNFELENKLEPERKSQLAREIGLEPRQVAIWFQNRRARYKTKQLERDYGSLKASYDRLMADYDLLKKEKEKLDSQVIQLTNQLKLTRQETVSAKSEPTTPIDCANTSADAQQPRAGCAAESTWEDASNAIAIASCKQEDASSARSVVFDPDSPPHCADYHGGHNHSGRCFSNLLEESANSSSLVAEPERGLSGFLQDEDPDRLSMDLSLPPLPSSCDFSPKIEDGCYEYDLPSVSNYSCNFAILNSVDDQHSFWSWMY